MYASAPTPNGPGKTAQEDLPRLKVIVCATLMGQSLDVTRKLTYRTRDVAPPGAHSHIANNHLEWIVFDPAQILP
jgi:hypothetical protein